MVTIYTKAATYQMDGSHVAAKWVSRIPPAG
jgi:hypothetical protein